MSDKETLLLTTIFQYPHTLGRMQEKGLAPIGFSAPQNRYLYQAMALCSRINEQTGCFYIDDIWEAMPTEGKTLWTNPATLMNYLMLGNPNQELAIFEVAPLMESVKREALEKALSVALDASRSGGDTSGTIALVERALNDSRGSTIPLPQSLKAGMQELAQAQMEEAVRVPLKTGLPHLDATLNELAGGELIVIGARPGVGKTSLVTQILVEAAKAGTPTLFYTGEMLVQAINRRILSQQAKVSWEHTIAPDKILDESTRSRVYQTMERLQALPVHNHAFHNRDIKQLCADAKRFVHIHNVKIICFDYLQLIDGTKESRSQGRYAEVSEISTALKQLATETGTVVIALAQFNRSSEQRTDKKPTMSDFRDSGKIEQDMDMGWLMSRPDLGSSTVLFQVAKNRNGKTGEFNLDFRGEHFWFEWSRDVEAIPSQESPRPRSRYNREEY
jgi:replicative DNA helicase